MTSFAQLGLAPSTLRVIEEKGFSQPSEIQRKAIPILLKNTHDFIGLAPTGTGKTGAFGWPLLQLVDSSFPYTQALILTPTRELGQQVAKELHTFNKYQDAVNVLCVYGGAPIQGQLKALKKPQHIIIATPGRLKDLMKRRAINLSMLSHLILDEADEMLNMGFKEEIDEIITYTPETRITWLFSATMSKEIRRIVKQYMTAPKEVRLEGLMEGNTNIDHQFSIVSHVDKVPALMRFIDDNPGLKAVVFCKTKIETQQVADKLIHKNYFADALHGDLQQGQRDRVMNSFRREEIQILVATDVAARGIDVADISHVFHLSLPDDLAYYTHRSGRTARAGKLGISLAILSSKETYRLNRLSKTLNINFTKIDVPKFEQVLKRKIQAWCLQVLNQKAKGNVDQDLKDYGYMLLHNLSKEELIDKMLAWELSTLQKEVKHDLNDRKIPRSNKDDKGGRRRDRSRGKRRHRGQDGSSRGSRRRSGRGSSRQHSRK